MWAAWDEGSRSHLSYKKLEEQQGNGCRKDPPGDKLKNNSKRWYRNMLCACHADWDCQLNWILCSEASANQPETCCPISGGSMRCHVACWSHLLNTCFCQEAAANNACMPLSDCCCQPSIHHDLDQGRASSYRCCIVRSTFKRGFVDTVISRMAHARVATPGRVLTVMEGERARLKLHIPGYIRRLEKEQAETRQKQPAKRRSKEEIAASRAS